MNSTLLELPAKPPEWPRISKFLVIALGLHLAVLLYPLTLSLGQVNIPPPATVMVRLVDADVPPEPLPLPLPVQAAPEPEPVPHAQPLPKPPLKQRAKVPRPILAMPAAPAALNATPDFSVPAVAEPVARPPADVAPASVPAPVTAARFDAAYLHNPRPDYPPLSRRLGEQGKVLLRVRVSPQGQAAAVDLEKSSNFQRLDEAARQVVAQWRFVPARRGNKAVEATVVVPIIFRLEG